MTTTPPPELSPGTRYEDTKRRAISGAKALAVRHVVVALMSLGGSVYLIRALGPEKWAAYSVAYYIVVFVDQNLGVSFLGHLVRSPAPPTEREIKAGAWLAQVTGLAGAAVVAVASIPAGAWYGRSDLTYALIGVAVCGWVYAARAVPAALLERRIDYRAIAIADVLDQATFYVVAVPLVVVGFGLPGAVVALAARGVLAALFLYWRAQAPFFGRRFVPEVKTLLAFGLPSMGMAAVLLSSGLVPLVVLGGDNAKELGFTVTAGTLLGYPVLFTAVVQRVGFPSMAELQGDPIGFSTGLQRLLTMTNTVVAVVVAPVAATSPLWLPFLFGGEWRPAGLVAVGIAAGLMYGAFSSLLGSALNSLGHPREALILWSIMIATYFVLALALVQTSVLLGTAVAFAISRVIGAAVAIWMVHRRGIRIRWVSDALVVTTASALMIGSALLIDDHEVALGLGVCVVATIAVSLARRGEIRLLISSLLTGRSSSALRA